MTKKKNPTDLGATSALGGADAGTQELIHVRATAHLPRHPDGYLPARARGDEALVDPDDPWIRRLLEGGWMIPIGEPDEPRRGE